MADILIHRIPGKDIEFLKGNWKPANPAADFSGWLITNLDKSQVYLFDELDKGFDEPELSVLSNKIYSEERYKGLLNDFLSDFDSKGIQKAIFSRVEEVVFSNESIAELVQKLSHRYPNAFVYALSSLDLGTWVGATPEVLLEVNANSFETMSLAGTKASQSETWTSKEKEEQQIVTDYIVSNLKEVAENIITDGQNTIKAGAVYHLQTKIIGDLKNCSTWALAQKLHPTPAVCGVPKLTALEHIKNSELHDRGLYTGIIGKISPKSAQLYVNLRCMQIGKDMAHLFVGGGITKSSDINKEWQETCNKAKTLKEVLDI